MTQPFQQSTPSIFVVTSPFQALCAFNASKAFEITDYHFYLALIEDIRNEQLFTLFQQQGIAYEVVNIENLTRSDRLQFLLPHFSKYKRLFIGDARNISQYFIGMSKVSNGGCMVYLDDGNDNIFLLKGHQPEVEKRVQLFQSLFAWACKVRGINNHNNIYTVYGDIPNPAFHIQQNDFQQVAHQQNHGDLRNVFFIGTNYDRFCEPGNLPLDGVMHNLETTFKTLQEQYGDRHTIYYIPHGRDTHDLPKTLCKKYNVQYVRPKVTVELFLANLGYQPFYVLGYTSTALYNIKLLFPQTRIENVVFNVEAANDFIKQIEVVTDYYEHHGIKTIYAEEK